MKLVLNRRCSGVSLLSHQCLPQNNNWYDPAIGKITMLCSIEGHVPCCAGTQRCGQTIWMSLACFFTPPWVKTLTSACTVCSLCFWNQHHKPVGAFLHRQCSERGACVTHAATGRETAEAFILPAEGAPPINVDDILTRRYLLFISLQYTVMCTACH